MNTNINIQDKYYNKYIKYKTKYLELKQRGGTVSSFMADSRVSTGTSVITDTQSCICTGDIKQICNGYEENMELNLEPHNILEIRMKYFKNKDSGNGKSNIQEIFDILNQKLNLLIKKNTNFIFGKNKISDIFEFIKKIINDLLYDYNNFGEYIYKQKIYSDQQILNYYSLKKKEIIDKITLYDTEINNKIKNIPLKNLNKDIISLDNLQFIIISYFDEIKKGLTCSIPNIVKYNSYKKLK